MAHPGPGQERMWALRLCRPGVFEKVSTRAPRPTDLRPGETLLRVVTGAICGSDLPYFRGAVSPLFDDSAPLAAERPGYPLHEVVGEVIASTDPELPPGVHAVGWATRTNALAEYVVTASASLIRLPEELDLADAVILQPLACVVDTLRAVGDLADRHVAVVGLGPFGLLFARVATTMGARRVTGVDPVDRSDVAVRFGIDSLVTTTSDRWARTIAAEDRPELVLEVVGHQTHTLAAAIEAAAPGGRIFCFGVPDEPVYPLPMQQIFRKSLSVSAGVVTERRQALRAAIDHWVSDPGLADGYFTHTFALDQAQAAFSRASAPAPGQLKIRLIAAGALADRRRPDAAGPGSSPRPKRGRTRRSIRAGPAARHTDQAPGTSASRL